MNNTFDIKRFGLLLKKDLFENWRKYLLQTLTLFSILLVCFLIQSFNTYNRQGPPSMSEYNYERINDQLVIITFIIFTASFAIFLSQMMDSLRTKQKRTHYLTFPCSALEKYTSKLIVHVLGFVVVFLIATYLADFLRVLVYSIPTDNLEVRSMELLKELSPKDKNRPMELLSAIYLFVMSLYVLGSTFWQRNGFVKTTVSVASIFILGGFMIYGVATALYTPGMYYDTPNFKSETLDILYYIGVSVPLAAAIFIVTLSYFRFKEAELIERW